MLLTWGSSWGGNRELKAVTIFLSELVALLSFNSDSSWAIVGWSDVSDWEDFSESDREVMMLVIIIMIRRPAGLTRVLPNFSATVSIRLRIDNLSRSSMGISPSSWRALMPLVVDSACSWREWRRADAWRI